PTDPAYGSLNLGAAVQLIAYAWRQALAARFGRFDIAPAGAAPRPADAAQLGALLAPRGHALVAIDPPDPGAPQKLMPRLPALLRAAPTRRSWAPCWRTGSRRWWPSAFWIRPRPRS